MSAAVSTRRSFRRSGDCTRSTKSWIVCGSPMSRLKAMLLINRCQRTSHATVSVSSAEIGDEPAENPGLVQPPQRDFRVLPRGQNVEEQTVGLGVLSQPRVDEAQRLGCREEGARMDVEIVLLGDMK